jgi:hypothetical protein
MREKEIAIPAFREHLYGTEIVTVRHFFFALKSPCGASLRRLKRLLAVR